MIVKRKPQKRNNLLIAAQNNSINTDYIKVENDNTQQNSKYELFSDR